MWGDTVVSRPLRARGLKPVLADDAIALPGVAPPAGAWIETELGVSTWHEVPVAPPAGAWIETAARAEGAFPHRVAPPAGAWIETSEEAAMPPCG